MGFNFLPQTWKELFSPSSYAKWYHMFWGIPLVLFLLLYWHLIVIPYRRLFKRK
jgi:hypothetical protein